MKAMTQLKAILTALALGVALLPAAQAQAQAQAQAKDVQTLQKGRDVKFPAGLKWETMRFANFLPGEDSMIQTATPAEKKAAAALWKKELDALPPNQFWDKKKGEYPADVLISTYENDKYHYIFSILSALYYPECSDENDGFRVGEFNRCSMRVVRMDKATRQTQQWLLKDYCFVYENYAKGVESKEFPFSKHHTEIAIQGNTAYHRVIYGGQWVPSCKRSIRLQ